MSETMDYAPVLNAMEPPEGLVHWVLGQGKLQHEVLLYKAGWAYEPLEDRNVPVVEVTCSGCGRTFHARKITAGGCCSSYAPDPFGWWNELTGEAVISGSHSTCPYCSTAAEVKHVSAVPGGVDQYYKPDCYPLVLQRNVSVFGRLLGDSDADKIADQQNTINRLEKKIIDRLVKAGTRVLMPAQARHRIDTKDQEVWFLDNMADASLIRDVNFTGNLQYELAYMGQVYEEARQAIGITDSFQGRVDTTAKSGVAKQFAAAQSAGRLESKRALKNAAYADLFRLIFQYRLAYADEPRPVVSRDSRGQPVYDQFDRYDFLERDENGDWYWNDQFLFSTDTSAPLANNREQLWQETISLFSAGCFGVPTELDTLVALWTKLELLHYPGAAETRRYLEEKLERQAAAQAQAAQAQQAAMGPPGGGEAAVASQVEDRAREDAMAAVFGGGQPAGH